MITLLAARLKTCVSAEKGWDDGRCAPDKKPIEDDEKLESWSSDRQVPKAGRSFETSPISVTNWASELQCMVPSQRGCQGFRACHSEVCGLGLELSRQLETLHRM